MGIYTCTQCRPKDIPAFGLGDTFKISVDKRGFVMSIQCTVCGGITGTLNFKDTIDKRFDGAGGGLNEDNSRRSGSGSDCKPGELRVPKSGREDSSGAGPDGDIEGSPSETQGSSGRES